MSTQTVSAKPGRRSQAAASEIAVFISYSHSADEKLIAPALQKGLRSLAKPWYRRRALKVIRDKTSLSASPSLWTTIETKLGQAQYFVLLASPAAARSRWVAKEVSWWLENRSASTLLIALTDGRLVWPPGAADFDWDRTDALPSVLQGAFDDVPFWIDLTDVRSAEQVSLRDPAFKDKVAELAATIRDEDKDDLIGEDARQHKWTLRIAWGVGIGLALLAVGLGITAYVAFTQRAEARRQRDAARAALSRQLATTALDRRSDDPQEALTLATRAYDTAHTRLAAAVLSLTTNEAIPERILRGHEDYITTAAFSPDGRRVVSGGADRSVRVWDTVAPGRPPVLLRGSRENVTGVAMARDGRHVVSSSEDRTLRVWDWRAPKQTAATLAARDRLSSAEFDPAGRTVVAAGSKGVILWEWRTGRRIRVASGHAMRSATISDDGRRLAGAGVDGTVRVWSLRELKRRPVLLRGHVGIVHTVSFAPDGRHIASGGQKGRVTIWDLRAPRHPPEVLTGHRDDVYAVDFAPDGVHLVSGGQDRTARVWNWRDPTGAPLILRGHDDLVYAAQFSPDGQRVVTAGSDKTVRVWEWQATNPAPTVLHDQSGSLYEVALAPDGRHVATGGDDGGVRIYDRSAPDTPPALLRGHGNKVYAAAFSNDGRHIVSAGTDETVRVWDWRQPSAAPVELFGHTDQVNAVAFAPDGRRVASAGRDGRLLIWDWRAPTRRPRLLGRVDKWINAAEFSPNGRQVMTAGDDGKVRIWDLQGGAPVALDAGKAGVLTAAFAVDGRHVVSGGLDGHLRVWRLDDPKHPTDIDTHQILVSAAAFTGDGNKIVSTGIEDTVDVWDWHSPATPPAVLSTGQPQPATIAIERHGTHVITAGGDGTARIWNCQVCASIDQVVTLARAHAPR